MIYAFHLSIFSQGQHVGLKGENPNKIFAKEECILFFTHNILGQRLIKSNGGFYAWISFLQFSVKTRFLRKNLQKY